MSAVIFIDVRSDHQSGPVSEGDLLRYIDDTRVPAMQELNAFYGGGAWCKTYQGTGTLRPPSAMFEFHIRPEETGLTALDMTRKIQQVFDKHWERAVSGVAYR
jgi:hypothetical protein